MQSAIKVSGSQLRSLEGPFLKWQGGNEQAFATGVGQPGSLQTTQLAFVSDRGFLKISLETASLLIVEEKILPGTLDLKDGQALWSTPSLKAAMVVVLPLFDPRRTVAPPANLISPQAFVHPTARLGARVRVEAGAWIGAGVEIGDDTHIRASAVVEDFCRIGRRCLIHATAVIGADGFGFATDPNGTHHKVPQIGIVVLEDDVEVGAGTTIDRATLGETHIGQGTKFDKQCHVAHNCRIGQYGLFAGGAMVAGSSIIGDHFAVGGGTLVTDHVNICDRVTVGGRSGVSKDITKPGAYMGYPLEPLREGLKTAQNLVHLTEMRRELKTIAKRLGLPEESSS